MRYLMVTPACSSSKWQPRQHSYWIPASRLKSVQPWYSPLISRPSNLRFDTDVPDGVDGGMLNGSGLGVSMCRVAPQNSAASRSHALNAPQQPSTALGVLASRCNQDHSLFTSPALDFGNADELRGNSALLNQRALGATFVTIGLVQRRLPALLRRTVSVDESDQH